MDDGLRKDASCVHDAKMRAVPAGVRYRMAARLTGLCLLVGGCSQSDVSPELGLVSGVVTIDGQPADEVMVTYQPQKEAGSKDSVIGGASSATTDSSGMFELRYKGGAVKGAVVGTHVVRMQASPGGGPAGGADAKKIVVIPAKYNEKSTLKAVVEPGENALHEFDLKSK